MKELMEEKEMTIGRLASKMFNDKYKRHSTSFSNIKEVIDHLCDVVAEEVQQQGLTDTESESEFLVWDEARLRASKAKKAKT